MRKNTPKFLYRSCLLKITNNKKQFDKPQFGNQYHKKVIFKL